MIPIGMSTTSVFPWSTERAFQAAKLAGFDGIEVMVTRDPSTQNADALLSLAAKYELPILSIHAPVLFLTQFVWGRDPQVKLDRSAELANAVGAESVVVHPPFRWQRDYAPSFLSSVRETAARHDVEIAVENMFPWAFRGMGTTVYSPGWDPTHMDADSVTLDFSHAALSGRDSLEMAMALGDRLRHIHLCDASGPAGGGGFDQHMIPGRGTQPVAETLRWLAESGWTGQVVAEVHTHLARTAEKRMALLRETVAFARAHTTTADIRRPGSVTDVDPAGISENV